MFACVLGEGLGLGFYKDSPFFGSSLTDVVSWYDRFPVAGAQAIFDSFEES